MLHRHRLHKIHDALPALTAPKVAMLGALVLVFAGCTTIDEPAEGALRKEMVVAVTATGDVIRFNAGQPRRVLERQALRGLKEGDRLVGIDYRVARGVLYALSARGQLYTLAVGSGELKPVGAGTALDLGGQPVGFDFNPVADRIRVVTANGLSWRVHPDQGTVVQEDGRLRYADGDAAHGQRAAVAGAGYTYNKTNDKITTNYAIDVARGALVRQGSMEGAQPMVSPNVGLLSTIGSLGTGPLDDAAFDISDVGNTALAAVARKGRTMLVGVDLASGRSTPIGSVDRGGALWGIAIEP